MKIRFLKTIGIDVESNGEFYDKTFTRWTEIRVEGVYPYGKFATVKLDNGDILHGVPGDAFEKLEEIKKTVTI